MIKVIPSALLYPPQTPFIALHAAIALVANSDRLGLEVLRRHCQNSNS